MIKTIRYSDLRWLIKGIHAVVILTIPFITINEKSLLRFDIPTLKLYVFGRSIWIDEFFILLLALLFLSFLFILFTVLFGRFWCGWLCPQTVLNDLADLFKPKIQKEQAFKTVLYHLIIAIISIVVGANLIWYFVSPYDFIKDLLQGQLGEVTTGFWVVLSVLMFLNLSLVGRRFCASVCPYSKLQSIMLDQHSLVIAFDNDRKQECMNCKACVRACPVGIDIREGLNPSCISCAECVDVCSSMTKKASRKTLIDYSFGLNQKGFRLLRPQVLIFFALTLSSLIFLLYLSSTRQMIDVLVIPNSNFKVSVSEGKNLTNSYILSISNRTTGDLSFSITAKSQQEHQLPVSPSEVFIQAGSHRQIPIYVNIPTLKVDYIYITLTTNKGEVIQKKAGVIPTDIGSN